MPIVGDVFSYTGGSAPGPAGTPISSTKMETRDGDVLSALNTAQSIPRGGTGDVSAVGAADNLSTTSSPIASATTTDLSTATGINVTISGTTTITGLGIVQAGARRNLLFGDALTLTHNGTSLILPTGANITTAAGDIFKMESLGSGSWRCVGYLLASGNSLAVEISDDLTPQLGGPLDTNNYPIYTTNGTATASATALALPMDGNLFDITGTNAITSINTWAVGAVATFHFTDILVFTHDATGLILTGGANITTAAGDIAVMHEYASGDWRCLSYAKASGAAVVGASSFTLEFIDPTPQTITSGGLLTRPHSLGVVPKLITLELICNTIDAGWQVGDIITMYNGFDASGSRGSFIYKDATNVYLRFGSDINSFRYGVKSTGTTSNLTNSSWDAIISAWA